MDAKRSKKLMILGGVLAAACLATLLALGLKSRQEQIQATGQVVLEVPVPSVQALSWTTREDPEGLALHREEEHWIYDADPAFPVDDQKVDDLLSQFQALAAAFTIEDPENLSDYGLTRPTAVIHLETAEEIYEITLGDFSTLDSQRYLSLGDGKVYLVNHDPYTDFQAQLSDLLLHDTIPHFQEIVSLDIKGVDEYRITYHPDGGPSYREEDRFFTQFGSGETPLDPELVEDYLTTISYTTLHDYVTYHAEPKDLAQYGLDRPELTLTVTYPGENSAETDTFVLQISRDPEELAQHTADQEEAPEDITAYARVGNSSIVYQINGTDYLELMACTYNDLRHHAVLPADFEDVTQLDIKLDGTSYLLTSRKESGQRVFSFNGQDVDITDVQNALTALTADTFTPATGTGELEIALSITLEGADHQPALVTIRLERWDGIHCLALVDGKPFALVNRTLAVNLMEAIRAIVLTPQVPVSTF